MWADVVWFCVPDSDIASAAAALANKIPWQGKIALHSSGALTSDELSSLRSRGAAVASAHPMMTFVEASRPGLEGVAFAVKEIRRPRGSRARWCASWGDVRIQFGNRIRPHTTRGERSLRRC